MVVIIGTDNLLEVEDSITQVVQLLQCLSFIEVSLAERSRWLFGTLGDLSQLVEVCKSLLRHLHLQEQKATLHQALADRLGVHFDRLGE